MIALKIQVHIIANTCAQNTAHQMFIHRYLMSTKMNERITTFWVMDIGYRV